MTSATSLENLREAIDAAHDLLTNAGADVGPIVNLRGGLTFISHFERTREALQVLSVAAHTLVPVLPYNTPGHVCPDTGRVAMTIRDAYRREDMPDRHFFIYNVEAADSGMDPWRLTDGMDATVKKGMDGLPLRYTLDFASGASRDVAPGFVVYMQRTTAERAA